MASTPVLPKLVGTRVKRREDPRLIQGRATYVDDVKIAGMQHIAFKRSDIAHGRIRSVDVTAAAAMEGVEAVFTGAQIAMMLEPLPIATPSAPVGIPKRPGREPRAWARSSRRSCSHARDSQPSSRNSGFIRRSWIAR